MKSVLLTGASGGLGIPVAEFFLKEGWHVHAACHNEAAQNSLQQHFPTEYNISLTTALVNLTHEEQVQSYVASAPSNLQAAVLLAGGFQGGKPLEETSVDTLEAMVSMNLRTVFLVLKYAMPLLKRQGGSIVTIGAKAVEHPAPNVTAYAASKAAVTALTLTIAEEGRAFGVRANCILPSVIKTAANLSWGTEEQSSTWITPEEIASTIHFLCSDEGKGINGSVLPMYGKISA